MSRDGPRELRGSRDRRGPRPFVRVGEGRPGGAPRRRRGVHGRRTGADRLGGLALVGVLHARRPALLRRDLLPADRPARHARVPAGARRPHRGLDGAPRRGRAAGGLARRRGRPRGPPRRRADAPGGWPDRRAARAALVRRNPFSSRGRALGELRSRVGWVRAPTQIPAAHAGRALPAPAPADRGPPLAGHGHHHARRDGGRRDLRPPGRGVLPLLDRPGMARPALREDAHGSGAPGAHLPPRLAGDRGGALPPGRDRDARLRDRAAGRRPVEASTPPRTPTPAASRGVTRPSPWRKCTKRSAWPAGRTWSMRSSTGTGSASAATGRGRTSSDAPSGLPWRDRRRSRRAAACCWRPGARRPTRARRQGPDRVERHGGDDPGGGGRGRREPRLGRASGAHRGLPLRRHAPARRPVAPLVAGGEGAASGLRGRPRVARRRAASSWRR